MRWNTGYVWIINVNVKLQRNPWSKAVSLPAKTKHYAKSRNCLNDDYQIVTLGKMMFTQYSTMTVKLILVSTQQTDPNRKVVVSDLISGASQRTHRPVQSWKGLRDCRSNRMPMKFGGRSSGPLSNMSSESILHLLSKMTFYIFLILPCPKPRLLTIGILLVYSHEAYHRKSVNPVEAFARFWNQNSRKRRFFGTADDSLSTSETPHTPVMTELVLDVICASEHAKKFQSKHNIEKLQMLVHCFAARGLRSISLFSICADCKSSSVAMGVFSCCVVLCTWRAGSATIACALWKCFWLLNAFVE